MKALLNAKIKRRESFRPFAPSVLEDAVPEWFEERRRRSVHDAGISNPARKTETHSSGDPRRRIGRLQTVSRDTNPLYWQLIAAFYERTGIPMVLNTSFNENEPVVCKPEEALDCFLRTQMDVLVLGNVKISRDKTINKLPDATAAQFVPT